MTTRRVYRWEHPVETTKYLLIYATLWYFNLILPGIVSGTSHERGLSTYDSLAVMGDIYRGGTTDQWHHYESPPRGYQA